MNKDTNRAAFWICSGQDYIEEARLSAVTVRRHMPDLRLFLFTPDESISLMSEFNNVVHLPPRMHKSWWPDSIRYLARALPTLPEHLIWMTADTYCLRPFEEIFEIVSVYDIAAPHTPLRATGGTVGKVPSLFSELSICVTGLRNTPVLVDFILKWYQLHVDNEAVYTTDQPSLREMLWNYFDMIRLYILPPEWLAILSVSNLVHGAASFLHGRPGNQFTYQDVGTMQRYAASVNEHADRIREWRAS